MSTALQMLGVRSNLVSTQIALQQKYQPSSMGENDNGRYKRQTRSEAFLISSYLKKFISLRFNSIGESRLSEEGVENSVCACIHTQGEGSK